MQYTVDKEIENAVSRVEAVACSLDACHRWADDDLTALLAHHVGENVGGVGFLAQTRIQRARLGGADKNKRELPAGEHLGGDLSIDETRSAKGGPRLVFYRNCSHQELPLAARFLGRGVDFSELHLLVVGLTADLGDKRALVVDVLRLDALEVAAVAHLTHQPEPLRAAGKTADERG